MSYGFIGADQAAKAQAFQQLTALMQQISRRKSWEKLNESMWTRAVALVFEKIGIRLTKQKLGQSLPVVGIGIGAGMNARLIKRTTEAAELAYRFRFLAEKQGDSAFADGNMKTNHSEMISLNPADYQGTETESGAR